MHPRTIKWFLLRRKISQEKLRLYEQCKGLMQEIKLIIRNRIPINPISLHFYKDVYDLLLPLTSIENLIKFGFKKLKRVFLSICLVLEKQQNNKLITPMAIFDCNKTLDSIIKVISLEEKHDCEIIIMKNDRIKSESVIEYVYYLNLNWLNSEFNWYYDEMANPVRYFCLDLDKSNNNRELKLVMSAFLKFLIVWGAMGCLLYHLTLNYTMFGAFFVLFFYVFFLVRSMIFLD